MYIGYFPSWMIIVVLPVLASWVVAAYMFVDLAEKKDPQFAHRRAVCLCDARQTQGVSEVYREPQQTRRIQADSSGCLEQRYK